MGICLSAEEKEDRARNREIEKDIEADRRAKKTEAKLLLLGAGESGKSTIVKQMKILNQNGYADQERLQFRPMIFANILQSAQLLVGAMESLNIQFERPESRSFAENIMFKSFEFYAEDEFTADLITGLMNFWNDEGIKTCVSRSKEFYLLDNAKYYYANLGRMQDKKYLPSDDDILHVRVKTSGITETRFFLGPVHIHMFDVGGQRSERKKWINCFENVTCVIFCAALSSYCQKLREDERVNTMMESIRLFEFIVSSKWFLRSSIVLFLNKTDLFKELIKDDPKPFANIFPEYEGDNSYEETKEYILKKFLAVNKNELIIYPHETCATDTRNIIIVFAAVKETILHNSLKDAGLL